MKVLIACEESQRVCIEFRKLGHEAWSCDLGPCSGGHEEWHIQSDVLSLLNGNCKFETMDGVSRNIDGEWDMIIAFPPCTYLTSAGNRWFDVKKYGEKAIRRMKDREDARKFFLRFVQAKCKKIAIENPVGVMTNAKLTAAMLSASKKTHKDERKYRYPENLKREYIPQEVFDFFDKMYDPSISDKELFGGKLDFSVGDCPGVIGYGGIHAAIPNYIFEQHGDRRIINKDVASYYPHLMTLCGYTSRNIPSPETFSNVLETRMRAKASGDKATANALKLVVNTTYGAMLNKFNDLYDPLMGRSVCITGQLFLLELARHLYQDIPDLKIVQLNTDGIMVECAESQFAAINEKFYVFCGCDKNERYDEAFWKQDVENLFERIFILKTFNCKPYIMRFEKVYESEYNSFYATVASWCNQPSIFRTFPFRLYAQCRAMRSGDYKKYKRDIDRYLKEVGWKGAEWRSMEMIENRFPEIAEKYFDFTGKPPSKYEWLDILLSDEEVE